jgi:hypothetical protein
MTRTTILKFLTICMSSTLIPALHATNYYVAVNGNDHNNGSLEAPFATIQRAENTVEPGDTVYIRGASTGFPPTRFLPMNLMTVMPV